MLGSMQVPTTQPQEEKLGLTGHLLRNYAVITVLVASSFYCLGLISYNNQFWAFGLDSHSLNLGWEQVVAAGFSIPLNALVDVSSWRSWAPWAALATLAFWGFRAMKGRGKWAAPLRGALGVLGALLFVSSLLLMSDWFIAKQSQAWDRPGGRGVRLVINPASRALFPPEFIKEAEGGTLRPIWVQGDHYILYSPALKSTYRIASRDLLLYELKVRNR